MPKCHTLLFEPWHSAVAVIRSLGMKPVEPSNWIRRIVPAGYTTATLSLTGTSPLLMSSGEADQEGELYRAYKLLGQTKKKSLDDESRLREMEWKLRLYFDAK